jgi:hypothetical protein
VYVCDILVKRHEKIIIDQKVSCSARWLRKSLALCRNHAAPASGPGFHQARVPLGQVRDTEAEHADIKLSWH